MKNITQTHIHSTILNLKFLYLYSLLINEEPIINSKELPEIEMEEKLAIKTLKITKLMVKLICIWKCWRTEIKAELRILSNRCFIDE